MCDCEEMVGRNMDVKDYSGEGLEGSEEHHRESFYHLREYKLSLTDVGRDENIKVVLVSHTMK